MRYTSSALGASIILILILSVAPPAYAVPESNPMRLAPSVGDVLTPIPERISPLLRVILEGGGVPSFSGRRQPLYPFALDPSAKGAYERMGRRIFFFVMVVFPAVPNSSFGFRPGMTDISWPLRLPSLKASRVPGPRRSLFAATATRDPSFPQYPDPNSAPAVAPRSLHFGPGSEGLNLRGVPEGTIPEFPSVWVHF